MKRTLWEKNDFEEEEGDFVDDGENTDKIKKSVSTKVIKMRKASSTTTMMEKDQRAF